MVFILLKNGTIITCHFDQPAALVQDVIDLMDALKIEKALIGGFDWEGDLPTSSQRFGRSVRRNGVNERLPDPTIVVNKLLLPPATEYQW